MRVNDTIDFGPGVVDATVNDKTGRIDAMTSHILNYVAVPVNLHQARRSDFIEHHAVRIDQHVFAAGHARGEVCEDQVGPAELRGKLICRGKVTTYLPLFVTDAPAQVGCINGREIGFHSHEIPRVAD